MLLSPVSWAQRVWALPFLTVLAPSERYCKEKGKKHKKLSDWSLQIAKVISRWFSDFKCIVVADGSYAVMELLNQVCEFQTWIVRFHMNAALYGFAPVYAEEEKPLRRPPLKSKK